MSVRMCTSYRKYTLLQITESSCHQWIQNLNHVYQSWTITPNFNGHTFKLKRMETTHGPTSFNENIDGGYCMTTKTVSEDSESGYFSDEISYVYQTSSLTMRDPQRLLWLREYCERWAAVENLSCSCWACTQVCWISVQCMWQIKWRVYLLQPVNSISVLYLQSEIHA